MTQAWGSSGITPRATDKPNTTELASDRFRTSQAGWVNLRKDQLLHSGPAHPIGGKAQQTNQIKENGKKQGQGKSSAKTLGGSVCPWAQALVSAEKGA